MRYKKIALIVNSVLFLLLIAVMQYGQLPFQDQVIIIVVFIAVEMIGVLGVNYMEKKYSQTLSPKLPLVMRLEKVEKICNACTLTGGKMKCSYYRNPDVVVTKCESSSNPDGE